MQRCVLDADGSLLQRSCLRRVVITAKESWNREVLDAEECWQQGIASLLAAKDC